MQTTDAKSMEEDAAILLWVRSQDGGQAMKLIYIGHPFGGSLSDEKGL
jgi:hypothetical protein